MTLPLTLPPGTSSTFTVAFTPASAGSFYSNLSLVNNSLASPLVVSLVGTSIAPVLQLSSSPTSLSFGSLTTGATSSQTVTVTNTGNSSVTVSSISVTGAGFSPSGFTLPFTLAAGQSATFNVAFVPASVGSLSGTLAVVSNATNSPLLIPLTGSGVTPVSHTVALGWTSSSSSYVGFNIYRGSQTGGPYTRINSSLISTTSYADTSVASGQTYFYVATEQDTSGLESAYFTEARATIP